MHGGGYRYRHRQAARTVLASFVSRHELPTGVLFIQSLPLLVGEHPLALTLQVSLPYYFHMDFPFTGTGHVSLAQQGGFSIRAIGPHSLAYRQYKKGAMQPWQA